jgi:hypothetical protein
MAYQITPTERHVGSAHDRLSHLLKGEIGAAFDQGIYRVIIPPSIKDYRPHFFGTDCLITFAEIVN